MAPAREGSFHANFSPETLENFKSLCRDQSRQYTKVLEKLAELYLGSQGSILDKAEIAQNCKQNTPDIEKLTKSIEQLETINAILREDLSETADQLKDIGSRLEKLERLEAK